ncbi:glycoside hydrolase family 47 protein [Hypholoma sublateritium FD-334 SS-4]|uniref:alpha-1,2-Mannosidase n=1 Tax=Hypholoma sublateritium (strain FD-334 SS-4) TaxID=945553 RepID=A0A0D2N8H9_HYPSF|nr:glycoside hydrolase family 47 protein [Hypholoma sublateritium FD-334 SS-4]
MYFALPVVGHILWQPFELSNYPQAPFPPHSRLGPHSRPGRPSTWPAPPRHQEQDKWDPKKIAVRETFRRAWTGYRTTAFPNDELTSLSGGKSNKFNGWAVTVFDSLSTMWLMGLREEFGAAVESVKDHYLKMEQDQTVPFFETVIRYLGGSLSAYALSGDQDILKFAEKLGTALLPAFNTSSGLPTFSVNVKTGKSGSDGGALFAEAATCQLEYKYLAKLTGRKEFYEPVQRIMNLFYKIDPDEGLFSLAYSRSKGEPAALLLTAGSMTDSGYEYLLKQWMISGDVLAKKQCNALSHLFFHSDIKSANGIVNNLIYVTPNRGLMYAGDIDNKKFIPRYQHLTCYLPGMLMLGVSVLQYDLTETEKEHHKWVAEGLAYTCYISYRDQKTNLGPEILGMVTGKRWMDEVTAWKASGRVGNPPGLSEPPAEKDKAKRDYSNWDSKYMLRPETVESIYYMWRFTGDLKWRNRGYEIYQAIEEHTRTEFGYASISDVDSGLRHMDEMPSFFLAETLKYLYLLFDDANALDLSTWVFNTEAHPLPVFFWTDSEKQAFNIQ